METCPGDALDLQLPPLYLHLYVKARLRQQNNDRSVILWGDFLFMWLFGSVAQFRKTK